MDDFFYFFFVLVVDKIEREEVMYNDISCMSI